MKHNQAVNVKDLARQGSGIKYSICTIVNNLVEYNAMLATFFEKGFVEDCEYLYADNSVCNSLEAYAACNLFLNYARGEFIVICHQDVRLVDDDRNALDIILADIEGYDPLWAACGNAGGVSRGKLVLRLTDPHGINQKMGRLPAKVASLDENFIIIKRSANLALSHDLQGFHLYGADLCIIANILGRTCYVVDFHLQHNSGGTRNKSFDKLQLELVDKYQRGFKSRWVTTTCTEFFLSGFPSMGRILSSHFVVRLLRLLSRRRI
jgi:hypothetical protein